MEYLSSDKVGIIDLATREIQEEDLDEELVKEKIGGAGITQALYNRFEDEDPVVLGAGLLCGTLVPASALGVMTAKSPVTGKMCHVPLTLDAGVELKYSGFDYIVIKGTASEPIYLWIHDGIADVEDAKDLWGKDVWASTDYVRETMGDDLIQVLAIGEAGESGSEIAQVCINYWASADRMGFGNLLGKKKVKLIALRGMGLLEIAEPEEMIDACQALLTEVKSGAFAGKKGIGELATAIGEEDLGDWIAPLVHRHSACFNTPFASNTFVFLDEDPSKVEESAVPEPGFLLTDIYGLLGLKGLGLSAADACGILKACAKSGVDPAAVAELCEKSQKKDPEEIKGSLLDLKGPVESVGQGPFSPWAPQKPLSKEFGLPEDGSEDSTWWMRRQGVAYIFGIHPIFALMSPALSEEKLIELANIGTDLDFAAETLDQVISEITG